MTCTDEKLETAILVHEYCLTFRREVEQFWGSRVTWGVFFFFNRYFVLLGHLPIVVMKFWHSTAHNQPAVSLLHPGHPTSLTKVGTDVSNPPPATYRGIGLKRIFRRCNAFRLYHQAEIVVIQLVVAGELRVAPIPSNNQ